jgi:hypothetical protein
MAEPGFQRDDVTVNFNYDHRFFQCFDGATVNL